MIEQYPARKHQEYRRDLPFGFSSSFIVHAGLILVLFSLATAYVVTETPAAQQVKNQIITIETLVRAPQPVPAKHPVLTAQGPPAQGSLSGQTAGGQGHRATAHVAVAALQAASVHKELATISRLPNIKPVKAPKLYTASAPVTGSSPVTATAINGGPSTVTGNDPSSGSGGDVAGNGHGPVWSDRPPSGPMGGDNGSFGGIIIHGGHDDCTPGRGGFLNGH